MTNSDILPRNAITAPVGPLAAYYDRLDQLSKEPEISITGKTRVLQLPAVARATLTVTAPPMESLINRLTTYGTVTTATLWLRLWTEQNHLSARSLAGRLQERFFPHGTSGMPSWSPYAKRTPRRGYDLLRAVDALGAGGLELHVSMPDPDHDYTYRRVRLCDAIATLEPSRLRLKNTSTTVDQRERVPIK
jgi:hypothetical protein